MPKRLPNRCRPDSIREFRQAAGQRLHDGFSLARAGRRTAAIYLWGYTAETILKAAYFQFIGFSPTQTISLADLRGAAANAPRLGFTWVGNLHNLESWALLLVSSRAATPGGAYPTSGFGKVVLSQARQLQRLWSETLRYHKNVAYGYEVDQVKTTAEWLFLNSSRL